MRNAKWQWLAAFLCLAMLAGAPLTAGATSVFNSYTEDFPEWNLSLRLPNAWEWMAEEIEGMPCVSLRPERLPELITMLVILPAEGAVQAFAEPFRDGAKAAFTPDALADWPDYREDGEETCLTVDGMPALLQPDGKGWRFISLYDVDRYIVYMFPDADIVDDPDYPGEVGMIFRNISLIENDRPYRSEEADFTSEAFEDGVRITAYTGHARRVRVPDTIGGKPVVAIGEEAFYEASVTHLALPDTVREIGAAAFSGCNLLRSAQLPASLTVIDNMAFESCILLSNVALPDSVQRIGESAFWGCFELTEITLPASLQSIGTGAFVLCRRMESVRVPEENEHFTVRDGVLFTKDMKTMLYYPCALAREDGVYHVPEGVETLAMFALFESGLRELVLPDSVRTLAEMSLPITRLERLVIPASVETIDRNAYGGNVEGVTVVGEPGSAAEAFAEQRGLAFEAIE